jgi:hypothetical protein
VIVTMTSLQVFSELDGQRRFVAPLLPAPGRNRPGSTVLTTLAVLAPESAGDSKYSLNCRDGADLERGDGRSQRAV